MSLSKLTPVVPTPMQIGECPLWHHIEQKLYWIDIHSRHIHQFDPQTHTHQFWSVSSEPGCIAIHQSGGLIAALREQVIHFNTHTGKETFLFKAPYDTKTTRFNDGRCDALGRLWVGTRYEPRDQANAQMYCITQDKITPQWGQFTVSNGLVFNLDQSSLLHADTKAHSIYQYQFHLKNGTATHRTLFRQFAFPEEANYLGRPDGAAIDSEGNYWYAMYEGKCLLKFSPHGEQLQHIPLPVTCPTMIAFGDNDLRTLYITSARFGRSPKECENYPLSGHLLKMRVDVAGIKEHTYTT
jgi:sugar lactone lactonase YvrE